MSTPYERYLEAIGGHLDGKYSPAERLFAVEVTAVSRDSTGNAAVAYGRVGKADGFPVAMGGKAVSVGDVIEVAQPVNNPAGGMLTYVGHLSSTNAGAGLINSDVPPPPPSFNGSPTFVIVATETSTLVQVTVKVKPIEAKWQPSGYIVSYRYTPPGGSVTKWTDQPVPPLTSDPIDVQLSTPFPPGASVDVKLRSQAAWTTETSDETNPVTISVPNDTAFPGTATGINVSTTTNGALLLTPSGTIDTTRFKAWRFYVATSAGGAGLVTKDDPAQFLFQGPPGNYYVGVAPVSHSGVLGTAYPVGGYDGPWVITAEFAPDTTPPTAFGAPTLTQRSVQDEMGATKFFLKVTLPAYSFSGDYDHTEVSLSDGTNPPFVGIIPDVQTSGEWRVEPGTWTVALRGVDHSGNRQVLWGTTASITINPIAGAPGAPSGPPTTTQRGLGIQVTWTQPSGSRWVQVERADDNVGTNTVDLKLHEGTFLIDIIATDQSTTYPVTKYYRYRGVNLAPNGTITYSPTWSAYASGSVMALHGSWLYADSITAREIVGNQAFFDEVMANKILSSTIKTANSGPRWEMEGATGAGSQLQFRLYDSGGHRSTLYQNGYVVYQGVEAYNRVSLLSDGLRLYADNSNVIRMFLTGNGLNFYNNSGTLQLSTGIDGSAYGYLSNFGGFTIRGPYAELDLSSSQFMYFPWTVAGNDYQAVYMTRMISGGTSYGFGFAGYRVTPGGYAAPRFVFSYTTDPMNRTTNFSAPNYVQIEGGTLYSSNWVKGEDAVYVGAYAATVLSGGYGSGWDLGSGNFKAYDMYAVRAGTSGIIFLGNQSGGGRYLYYDGSNYNMPGASLYVGDVGNGAHMVYAHGVALTSSARIKKNIAPAVIDKAKVSALRAKRYNLLEDGPNTPARLGFVAEDVADALPNAVSWRRDARESGPTPDPVLSYDLASLLAVAWERIAELEGRIAVLEKPGLK